MADKKGDVERWSRSTDAHATDFAKPKSPLGPQVGAWVLWIVGLVLQCAGVLYATGALSALGDAAGIELPELPKALVVIVALVLDLVLVLLATRLWKTAARRKAQARGASSTAGAKGSAVGVVMACIAFVPMTLFFLTAKNADKKVVGIGALGALVVIAALVVASLLV